MPVSNTVAYLASSKVTKEKGFITLTPADRQVDEIVNEQFRAERLEVRRGNDFAEDEETEFTSGRHLEVVADLRPSQLDVPRQNFAEHHGFARLTTTIENFFFASASPKKVEVFSDEREEREERDRRERRLRRLRRLRRES